MIDEREAFIHAHPHLDLTEDQDMWGRPRFAHTHVEAMWEGWRKRAEATVRLSDGRQMREDRNG